MYIIHRMPNVVTLADAAKDNARWGNSLNSLCMLPIEIEWFGMNTGVWECIWAISDEDFKRYHLTLALEAHHV